MIKNSITRFPFGSILALASLALPLMFNTLSNNLMLFFDRLIIARSSTDEMNAAVTIGMACSIAIFATTAIASSSEIFVGRYRGSNSFSKIGSPVWQMIWFSLLTYIFFIPIGLFCSDLFIPIKYKELGLSFFQIYTFFGPIFPLVAALTTFYLGQGKVKLVTVTLIIGNVINFFLALVLVLGIDNIITPMGMKGAAIATVVAQSIQALILIMGFLSKRNRQIYGTNCISLDFKQFMGCIQIGAPLAIAYILELAAWTFLLHTLALSGDAYITVFTIGQSLFVLFAFISEGMQKSIAILVSNAIGANIIESVNSIFKSAIQLHLIFGIVIAIPLLLYSNNLVHSFTTNAVFQDIESLRKVSVVSLMYFWLFFIFDGFKWIIASILIAFEKALSVMVLNFASVWIFAIVPIYILVKIYQTPPLSIWIILVAYSIINAIFLFKRWKKI